MKSALPVNSIRFINGDTFGTNRFNIKPDMNAPKIPSKPTASDNAAERNTTARMKINCITASEYRRRNQRVTRGITIIKPTQ